MTRFVFVRHGESELVGKRIAGRMPGVDLTPRGRAQARKLALRLSGMKIDALYASPQRRARQTAETIAEACRLPIRSDNALDELDYGDWTGMSIAELAPLKEWQAFNTVRSCTRIPHGELMIEVQTRLVQWISRRCEYDPQTVLAVVTHADVIRVGLAYYLNVPLDHMLRLEIEPASISVVDIAPHGPCIHCINDREAAAE